jgi:hypothetical protein
MHERVSVMTIRTTDAAVSQVRLGAMSPALETPKVRLGAMSPALETSKGLVRVVSPGVV